MRMYQPIWEQLKNDKLVSLQADCALHRRIIKAVIKEKTKDIGFKVLCYEQDNLYRLAYKADSETGVLTFQLNPELTLKNL